MYSRLNPISVESLTKAMLHMTVKVERLIRTRLSDMFALGFDGWSSGSTHFLGVFAVFPRRDAKDGYERALLSFAPFLDEEHLNADSHKQSIYEILRFYDKDYSNVASIIGDNCSTNVSLAKKARVFPLDVRVIVSI